VKYRKLSIVWSVAWGVVAVLLCVLWVRSYSACDMASLYGHKLVVSLGTAYFDDDVRTVGITPDGRRVTHSLISINKFRSVPVAYANLSGKGTSARLWLIAVMALSVSAVPWLRYFPRRFSLRTLLIATTLIAVVLGLVVWALRS
jgi:hypothetical protein